MQFTPRSVEDLELDEKKREEALLLQKGDYDFEVTEAIEKTSKSGNPMIQVRLKVFHEDSFRFVTDYLMEKMAFKLRHFAESVGLLEEYNAGEFVAADCVGKCGKVKIVVEKPKGNFEAKNSVKDYGEKKKADASAKGPLMNAGPKDQLPDDGDFVPF